MTCTGLTGGLAGYGGAVGLVLTRTVVPCPSVLARSESHSASQVPEVVNVDGNVVVNVDGNSWPGENMLVSQMEAWRGICSGI